jgi:hypothetical protein
MVEPLVTPFKRGVVRTLVARCARTEKGAACRTGDAADRAGSRQCRVAATGKRVRSLPLVDMGFTV